MLASLNHPNIVTIYSVEEAAGTRFVTMELLEGESLDAIVAKGGLPEDQFISLALQLLDAMQTAHGKGVVHRDLKLANIMITEGQRLKVLDFGLAKVFLGEAPKGLPSEEKTLQHLFSLSQGRFSAPSPTSLPNRRKGKRSSHRSDIFSLGIILYEMATGRHPFPGDNAAGIISSILRDAPAPFQRRTLALAAPSQSLSAAWRRTQIDGINRCRTLQMTWSGFGKSRPPIRVRGEAPPDLVQAGRDALTRHSWSKGFECLQQADSQAELSCDDLERLADAARGGSERWTTAATRSSALMLAICVRAAHGGQP